MAQINAEVEAIQSGQVDYDADLAKIDKVLGAHDEKRQEYLRLYRADKISQEDLDLMLGEMQLERIVHERNRRDIVAKLRQGSAATGWADTARQVLQELQESALPTPLFWASDVQIRRNVHRVDGVRVQYP